MFLMVLIQQMDAICVGCYEHCCTIDWLTFWDEDCRNPLLPLFLPTPISVNAIDNWFLVLQLQRVWSWPLSSDWCSLRRPTPLPTPKTPNSNNSRKGSVASRIRQYSTGSSSPNSECSQKKVMTSQRDGLECCGGHKEGFQCSDSERGASLLTLHIE